MFPWCLKEVKWVFKGRLKVASRIFQGSFNGISRNIEWCSEGALKEIQGRFKGF